MNPIASVVSDYPSEIMEVVAIVKSKHLLLFTGQDRSRECYRQRMISSGF
jgi:hypothetical protein